MSTQDRSGPDQSLTLWLRYNRIVAVALPAPDQEWTVRDVPFDHSTINRLHRDAAIERVRRTREPGDCSTVSVWRTAPGVYEHIQQRIDRPHETPCGNSGVHCIERGETYTCTDDDCDCRFGPETARAVMAR